MNSDSLESLPGQMDGFNREMEEGDFDDNRGQSRSLKNV
jgi:hypothetical protein